MQPQPISAIAETAEVSNQPPAAAERALPVIRVTLALVLIVAVCGGLYWYISCDLSLASTPQ